MIKAAIDRILDLGKPEIYELASRIYTSRGLSPVFEPQPKALQVSSLTSFIEYVISNFDSLDQPCKVHIAGPDRVSLISSLYGPFRQRDTFIDAVHNEPSKFYSGKFYDLEEFCILLRTSFYWTPAIDDLLKVFGNVRGETVAQWSDDGVSQTVQARKGIALVEEVKIPNPVTLQPYRTFREIAQPESIFIVRAKSQDGKAPIVALFECEGEQWKLRAVEAIQEFLKQSLPEGTIILA